MKQLSVNVTTKTQEAQGICRFELQSVDGQALPAFTAGAHIDIHLADGLVRQYSLCNAPGERHRYVIAVLRDAASRGGSVAMHDRIQAGDVIQISEPRNHFALVPAQRQVLLAGGIGVTPILCMAHELQHRGADFEMHYCSRSVERTAFKADIERAAFADKVHFHFDEGEHEQKFDANTLLAQPTAGTHLYVCGPSGFIAHVLETAKLLGWPDAQVHREFFANAPIDHHADGPFDVKLASSGQTYAIPVGKTVLEILIAQGVDVPASCEAGVCGTCVTRVLEGTPDHRDAYLTDAEHATNTQFTPCCSRAKSPLLVLDL